MSFTGFFMKIIDLLMVLTGGLCMSTITQSIEFHLSRNLKISTGMKQQANLFSQGLNKPDTSIQEVLFELITNGNASIVQFFWMPGFRSRISELRLRYNISLTDIEKKGKNRFGREYSYTVHILPNELIDKAKKV